MINVEKVVNQNTLNTVQNIDFDDVIEEGNRAEERPRRPKQPKLFLTQSTAKKRSPLVYLIKSYFEYLPTDEEVFNMMLLTGKYEVDKLDEHIREIMSKPLDVPKEKTSLKEINILVEVKAICIKYQNLLGYSTVFRPDINTVGNALICTGDFSVDKAVNEIAALKKRPKDLRVSYRVPRNNYQNPRVV